MRYVIEHPAIIDSRLTHNDELKTQRYKQELRKRLERRGRDNKTEIKKRLSLAVNEISHYGEYKYSIVNDNIIKTVNYIIKIIELEEILNQMSKKVKDVNIH